MLLRLNYITLVVSLAVILQSCGSRSSDTNLQSKNGTDTSSSAELLAANAEVENNLSDAEAYRKRAVLYDSLKMIDPALRDMQKATDLDSMNGKYYTYLGDLYVKRRNETNALGAYSIAVSRDPKQARAYLQIGRLYLISKQRKLSIENLNNALKVEPTLAEAYLYKGLNYKEDGNLKAATSNFRQAIELKTDYFEAYEQMGLVSAELKDPKAPEYFQAALRLRPGQTTTLYALALTYQEMDSTAKATATYKQILEKEPNDLNANNNLGVMALNAKKYQEALNYFNKALAADPDWGMGHENRANAYEGLGDKLKAKSERERAKELTGKETLPKQR